MAIAAAAERVPVLTYGPRCCRAGATLVELLVAITLAALVLGTATTSVLRQQRGARRLHGMAASAAQGRAASSLVPAELSDLVPSAGDLVAGEARDSALLLRSPIASGVACESAVGRALFPLGDVDDLAPGGLSSAPRAGDSLWWYAEASTSWRAQRIRDVSGAAHCPAGTAGAGSEVQLSLTDRDTIAAGTFLRVTRPVGYVFYRSGDGSWQLGMREWSEATQRLAPPQPIAGPFAKRIGADARTGFRYFGLDESELPVGSAGAEVSRIARIRITTVTGLRPAIAGDEALHVDSVDVPLQRLRNP
jgi:hypothetical protein